MDKKTGNGINNTGMIPEIKLESNEHSNETIGVVGTASCNSNLDRSMVKDALDKTVSKRKNDSLPEKAHRKRRKRIIVKQESSSSEEEGYTLTVANMPKTWSYVDIKNYFDTECGTVDEIEMLKQNEGGICAIGLSFLSLERCKKALKCLQDKEIEGNKLEVKMNGNYDTEDSNEKETKTEIATEDSTVGKSPVPKEEAWDPKDHELYGLRPQLLKSLGIVPPLDKWIHVTNFRCDKSELRNVLELAGNVLVITIVAGPHKFAKVMYNHPLEAVQAVSMLNGQTFFGSNLKISMERNPTDAYLLPKGLANIGLGLGILGKPIRNIEKQYKRFLKKQKSDVNPLLFTHKDDNTDTERASDESKDDEVNKHIEQLVASCNGTTAKCFEVKSVEDLNVKTDEKTPEVKAKPKSNVKAPEPQNKPKPVPNSDTATVSIRLSQPSPNRNPLLQHPVPRNGPQFGPGFSSLRPGPYGPRPGPYMPHYGPQPVPAPYGPRPMPMAMSPAGPMMNTAMPGPVGQQVNHVTVQFYNVRWAFVDTTRSTVKENIVMKPACPQECVKSANPHWASVVDYGLIPLLSKENSD